MLQYILSKSENYSVAELAQMAIEGGCLWISLSLPEMSDEALGEAVSPEVVDMCKEAGVFLTVDNRPGLARRLGLHGIRLSLDYMNSHPENSPMAMREELGPEAVIGVEVSDPFAVPALMPADIDFVSIPVGFNREQRKSFVNSLRKLEIKLPVVAQGDFSPEEAVETMMDGCNGVAVCASITNAKDPIKATEAILHGLELV